MANNDGSRSLIEYAQTENLFESKPRGYLEVYEEYFRARMNDDVRLLELGVASGQSMRMWQDYFRNGQVVGIDLLPRFEHGPGDERIHIRQGP